MTAAVVTAMVMNSLIIAAVIHYYYFVTASQDYLHFSTSTGYPNSGTEVEKSVARHFASFVVLIEICIITPLGSTHTNLLSLRL